MEDQNNVKIDDKKLELKNLISNPEQEVNGASSSNEDPNKAEDEKNEDSKIEGSETVVKENKKKNENSENNLKDSSKKSGRSSPLSHNRTKYKSQTPSPTSSSPEPSCAICLDQLTNKSFTNSCFHMFCFTCLVEWSKVKPECPLCKQSFTSIVHNVRSFEEYDQYHISARARTPDTMWSFDRRFRYSTTMTQERLISRAQAIDNSIVNEIASHRLRYAPHSVHHIRMYSQPQITRRRPSYFRRRVYEEDLWVHRPAGNRVRLATPSFFQRNIACTHRLLPWLNRELMVVMPHNEGEISFMIDLIMSLILKYYIRSPEFFIHIQPYTGNYTTHFIHEFYNFAISPYEMELYDYHAVYDVDILLESPPDGNIVPLHVTDTSSSSSHDDIEIVQVLKPKCERTLEIIDLSSDDENCTSTADVSSAVHELPSRVIEISSDVLFSSADDDDVMFLEEKQAVPDKPIDYSLKAPEKTTEIESENSKLKENDPSSSSKETEVEQPSKKKVSSIVKSTVQAIANDSRSSWSLSSLPKRKLFASHEGRSTESCSDDAHRLTPENNLQELKRKVRDVFDAVYVKTNLLSERVTGLTEGNSVSLNIKKQPIDLESSFQQVSKITKENMPHIKLKEDKVSPDSTGDLSKQVKRGIITEVSDEIIKMSKSLPIIENGTNSTLLCEKPACNSVNIFPSQAQDVQNLYAAIKTEMYADFDKKVSLDANEKYCENKKIEFINEPILDESIPATQIISNFRPFVNDNSRLMQVLFPDSSLEETFVMENTCSDDEIAIIEVKTTPKVKEVVLIDDDDLDITVHNEYNSKSLFRCDVDETKEKSSKYKSSEKEVKNDDTKQKPSESKSRDCNISNDTKIYDKTESSTVSKEKQKHKEQNSKHRNSVDEHLKLHSEHKFSEENFLKSPSKHSNSKNEYSKSHSKHRGSKNQHSKLESEHRDSKDEYSKSDSKYRYSTNKYSKLDSKCRESKDGYSKFISKPGSTDEHLKKNIKCKDSKTEDSISKCRASEDEHSESSLKHKTSEDEYLKSHSEHKNLKEGCSESNSKHRHPVNEKIFSKHEEFKVKSSKLHYKEIQSKEHLKLNFKHKYSKDDTSKYKKSEKHSFNTNNEIFDSIPSKKAKNSCDKEKRGKSTTKEYILDAKSCGHDKGFKSKDKKSMDFSNLIKSDSSTFEKDKYNCSSVEKENYHSSNKKSKNEFLISLKPSSTKRKQEHSDIHSDSKKLKFDDSSNYVSCSGNSSVKSDLGKDTVIDPQMVNSDSNDSSLRDSSKITSTSDIVKVIRKQELKEEIANEVKMVLKPYFMTGVITKDNYKEIMRKSVPKIFLNCHNAINSEKIKKLVLGYVSLLNKSL